MDVSKRKNMGQKDRQGSTLTGRIINKKKSFSGFTSAVETTVVIGAREVAIYLAQNPNL